MCQYIEIAVLHELSVQQSTDSTHCTQGVFCGTLVVQTDQTETSNYGITGKNVTTMSGLPKLEALEVFTDIFTPQRSSFVTFYDSDILVP